MTTKRRSRLAGALLIFVHAAAAAGAVEAGHTPKSRDLSALGIDPQLFGRIGRG